METVEIRKYKNSDFPRFPIQTIIRPHSPGFHDYRGYSGRVAGGTFRPCDKVTVFPSRYQSRIKSIDLMGKSLEESNAGNSVSITLEYEIDISRGDVLVTGENLPLVGQEINLMVCWFNEKPLRSGGRYLVRINTNEAGCIIRSVQYRMNINTLEKDAENTCVEMNDIAHITIKTSKPVVYDPYQNNNITGSMIFIDEGSNDRVAAGMIVR